MEEIKKPLIDKIRYMIQCNTDHARRMDERIHERSSAGDWIGAGCAEIERNCYNRIVKDLISLVEE